LKREPFLLDHFFLSGSLCPEPPRERRGTAYLACCLFLFFFVLNWRRLGVTPWTSCGCLLLFSAEELIDLFEAFRPGFVFFHPFQSRSEVFQPVDLFVFLGRASNHRPFRSRPPFFPHLSTFFLWYKVVFPVLISSSSPRHRSSGLKRLSFPLTPRRPPRALPHVPPSLSSSSAFFVARTCIDCVWSSFFFSGTTLSVPFFVSCLNMGFRRSLERLPCSALRPSAPYLPFPFWCVRAFFSPLPRDEWKFRFLKSLDRACKSRQPPRPQLSSTKLLDPLALRRRPLFPPRWPASPPKFRFGGRLLFPSFPLLFSFDSRPASLLSPLPRQVPVATPILTRPSVSQTVGIFLDFEAVPSLFPCDPEPFFEMEALGLYLQRVAD